jgi:cytoskeleton protein RodZ
MIGGEKERFEDAAQGASAVPGGEGADASIDQDDAQLALPLSSERHIMRAEELAPDGKTASEVMTDSIHIHRADADESAAEIRLPTPDTEPSFGSRLRAAREEKHLALADIAQRLRLPLRLVERLEQDDYSGMDQGVYLRGYLSSYARMVGLPSVAAETVAVAHMRAAPLVATGQVSRSRYLFDRYSVSATYLILTALIVVPAVWLATHGGLEQNLARTTSLDAPSTSLQIPAAPQTDAMTGNDAKPASTGDSADTAPSDTTASVAAVEPPKPQEQMVIASMAPFGASSTPAAPAAPTPEPPAAHAATGAHSLTLKLTAASWVEILGADGSKLEYGLIPAGAERTYSSDGPVSVRVGNADGASVVVDGKPLDLAPFRHANVARIRLFDANGGDSPRAEF